MTYPTRQRTMRDTIAWSYDLLTPADASTLSLPGRLRRGLDARGGGGSQLWHRSGSRSCGAWKPSSRPVWCRRWNPPDGERRFGMLETVREFGVEQLEQQGEVDAVRRHHADYFVAMTQAGSPALGGDAPGAVAHPSRGRAGQPACRPHLAAGPGAECDRPAVGRQRSAGSGACAAPVAEGRAWLETFLTQPEVEAASASSRRPHHRVTVGRENWPGWKAIRETAESAPFREPRPSAHDRRQTWDCRRLGGVGIGIVSTRRHCAQRWPL